MVGVSSVWRWGVLPDVYPVGVAFALVEVAQQAGVEVRGPDSVRQLLEPDAFADERGGQRDGAVLDAAYRGALAARSGSHHVWMQGYFAGAYMTARRVRRAAEALVGQIGRDGGGAVSKLQKR